MKLHVNGQERECGAKNLSELWDQESRELAIETPQGYAIALNGQLVRRKDWKETQIMAGDRIEIVRAFAGG